MYLTGYLQRSRSCAPSVRAGRPKLWTTVTACSFFCAPDRPSSTPDLGYPVPSRRPPSLANLSTVHETRTQTSQDWVNIG